MAFDPFHPPTLSLLASPLGGRLRETPDDFVVHEVALYPPSGDGEHLMLLVEKRGLTTAALVRALSRALRVGEREIGHAGLKDRHAVTRQWLTLPRKTAVALETLALPGIHVLEAHPHRNKLRIGHLRANRFEIRVRGVAEARAAEVAAALRRLEAEGVPNAFGPQRFGSCGNNHLLGEALVRGDASRFVAVLSESDPARETPRLAEARAHLAAGRHEEAARAFPPDFRVERELAQALARGRSPADAVRAIHPRARDFLVSAWQSRCFNAVLAARLARAEVLMLGDVAMKHANGACFLVEDLGQELPRASTLEISPTGPMPGPKMLAPQGEPAVIEGTVLEAAGATTIERSPLLPGGPPPGARRALRVPITEASATADGEDLVLRFTLPRGAFATSVLAQFGVGGLAEISDDA